MTGEINYVERMTSRAMCSVYSFLDVESHTRLASASRFTNTHSGLPANDEEKQTRLESLCSSASWDKSVDFYQRRVHTDTDPQKNKNKFHSMNPPERVMRRIRPKRIKRLILGSKGYHETSRIAIKHQSKKVHRLQCKFLDATCQETNLETLCLIKQCINLKSLQMDFMNRPVPEFPGLKDLQRLALLRVPWHANNRLANIGSTYPNLLQLEISAVDPVFLGEENPPLGTLHKLRDVTLKNIQLCPKSIAHVFRMKTLQRVSVNCDTPYRHLDRCTCLHEIHKLPRLSHLELCLEGIRAHCLKNLHRCYRLESLVIRIPVDFGLTEIEELLLKMPLLRKTKLMFCNQQQLNETELFVQTQNRVLTYKRTTSPEQTNNTYANGLCG